MELGFGKRLERGESWWLEKWSLSFEVGDGSRVHILKGQVVCVNGFV